MDIISDNELIIELNKAVKDLSGDLEIMEERERIANKRIADLERTTLEQAKKIIELKNKYADAMGHARKIDISEVGK